MITAEDGFGKRSEGPLRASRQNQRRASTLTPSFDYCDGPWRDRTSGPLITYHLGFRRPRGVRGLDYPFTVSPAGFGWTPSSLYAFPGSEGLGSGSPSPEAEGFPEFDAF